MNLDGRRESSNVEDRRGMSGGKKAGMGAGVLGVIIAMAIAYFSGGDPLSAGMQALQENGGLGSLAGTNTEVSEEQREFTEEEQELARFSTQILAGTEDVWKEIFEENEMEYEVPTMVLYTDGTQTACGQGSDGSVLLLWRPETVYRPVVLHHHETETRCRWRLRLCLRHCP